MAKKTKVNFQYGDHTATCLTTFLNLLRGFKCFTVRVNELAPENIVCSNNASTRNFCKNERMTVIMKVTSHILDYVFHTIILDHSELYMLLK